MKFALGGALLALCACHRGRARDRASNAAASAAPSAPTFVPAPPPGASPCGDLDCLAFDSPEQAFSFILQAERPRVLAIGEAHAPKGAEGIESATARFSERLLPLLSRRASDLVVEALLPPAHCEKAKKDVVERVDKPVTSAERPTNKSEFAQLGERAKVLGVQPWALSPSCAEMQAVADAGQDGVVEMLSLIARLTEQRIEKLLQARAPDALIASYGGALHNDLHPDAAHKAWSFGPQLFERTAGRYVQLDLIVPELIRDDDGWRRLPWYGHYHPQAGKTTLLRTAAHCYAFFFPRAQPPGAPN